jgi:hypothetical protein
LPSATVRDGETFVLTWSVLPMSAKDINAAGLSSGLWTKTRDGFRTTVDFNVATGPVKPCEPVSITPS